jgi:phosphatidylglycerophosphate synthase
MRLDDVVADAFVDRTEIFENIHPNLITGTSLLLNVLILMVLLSWRRGINFGLLAALFAVRCATDILDGAVARKYKKTSELGGYLDTLGDLMLFIIFSYFMFDRYNVRSVYWIPLIAFILFTITHFDVAHDHSSLKVYNGGPYQHFAAFCANNTVVVFPVIYALIWKGA